MKRCYLVCGPENAGNRLLASVLVRAGCKGRAATFQEWSEGLPEHADPAVVIRSLPHGDEWPDLTGAVETLKERKYAVTVLVPTRDPWALASSQMSRGLVRSRTEGLERAAYAYRLVFTSLPWSTPVLAVPYEALVTDPEDAVAGLLSLLDLPLVTRGALEVEGEERTITNENRKHYAALRELVP